MTLVALKDWLVTWQLRGRSLGYRHRWRFILFHRRKLFQPIALSKGQRQRKEHAANPESVRLNNSLAEKFHRTRPPTNLLTVAAPILAFFYLSPLN